MPYMKKGVYMAKKKLPKNISLRSDGRYMGRFTYRGEAYTLYGENPTKLKKELDNLRYEVEHGMYKRTSQKYYEEWFFIWLEDFKKNYIKQGTYQTYKNVYKNMLSQYLKKVKLSEIDTPMIQRILNELYASDYSTGRLKIAFAIISGSLGQAVLNGDIQFNPALSCKIPQKVKSYKAIADVPEKEKKKAIALTIEEQELFLQHAKNSIYYPIYEFALSTGMRIGEILSLQWSNVNFDKKEISVTGTLIYVREEKRRYKDTPKSKSGIRDIPMLNNVVTLLKAERKKQLEQRMMLGNKYGTKTEIEDLVFTGEAGDAIWDTAIRVDMKKIIAKIKKDHDFPDNVTPHTFRHTFATRGLENGVDMTTMRDILGHSTLAMTMDLYSHVLPNKKKEEMEKLQGVF